MNEIINVLKNAELQLLNKNYLEPAKFLLSHSNNSNGNLCAAALILLCLVDRLSQIDDKCDRGKEERYKKFWRKYFPVNAQLSPCGKYELYPKDKSEDCAADVVYALFRSSLVHNGASLKYHFPSDNCKWAEMLGDWFQRHDEFEIVNRQGSEHKEAPVFCLNTEKDKKGHIEITLDVDKILKKIQKMFAEIESDQKGVTIVGSNLQHVEVSATVNLKSFSATC